MIKNDVEHVVQVGLGVMLVVLFLLGIVGMYQIRSTNQNISDLVHDNNQKVMFAHEMRDAIRLREIGINKMQANEDPFERDEELIRFYEHSGIYRHARSKLLELPMDDNEKEILKKIDNVVKIAQPLNKKAAEQISDDVELSVIIKTVDEANKEQQKLLTLLDQLVERQNRQAQETLHIGAEKYDSTLLFVMLLGMILVIGALFIVKKVSKYVAARNQELLVKNHQLQEASQAALSATNTKSAFLATMSHEIRTPLTAIIGFAETSLESDQTLEDRVGATKTIIRSGKHLLRIINDILDISKIEANKLETECLELSPFKLLSDVESIVKPQAVSKGLTFKVEYQLPLPKVIVSDPLRLKQILINLVSNAIKFTETGHVIILVKFDQDHSKISFTVNDSGIGMSEAQSVKIFDAFTQADASTTRKYGGTGLGLSLSKELAQVLGGDITVKSLLNTGSQFELLINAGDEIRFDLIRDSKDIPVINTSEALSIIEDRFDGKVLLAEDNPDNQLLLTHILNKLGVSLSIAENGKVALEMAFKENYDLILMDMQMPVLGGLEAVSLLRENGYRKPIVALTANAMKKDKEESINAGCDDFLTKPIDRNELRRVASKFLQKEAVSHEQHAKITSRLLDEEPELIDLVKKYCDHLPSVYKDIKQHEQDQDWTVIGKLIHQMQGIGGGMGFPMLTEMAGKIQFQIANEDYEVVSKLIVELGNIIDRIVAPAITENTPLDNVKLLKYETPDLA